MAVCIDPNCKPHMRGEVVPVIVEVNSETDTKFDILTNVNRTYCELRTTGGDLVLTMPVIVQVLTDTKKQIYSSWDTSKLEIGYYLLRFWVGINLFGNTDLEGDLIEDFRIVSPEIKRYIKAD